MKKIDNTPSITESEWLVMEIVWERKSVTAQEVMDSLYDSKNWASATIKTLLARLREKSVIDYEVDGRAYRYFATLSKADCVKKETGSFLNKIFSGKFQPLLAHFAEEHDLSKDDIKELQALLRKKKK